jgi:hypothetical protein
MKRLPVTCRQCGKTVSDTDVSCPSCGRKLDVPPTILAPNTSRKELDAFVDYLRGVGINNFYSGYPWRLVANYFRDEVDVATFLIRTYPGT